MNKFLMSLLGLKTPVSEEECKKRIAAKTSQWLDDTLDNFIREKLQKLNDICRRKNEATELKIKALKKEYDILKRMSKMPNFETYEEKINAICIQARESTIMLIVNSEEWKRTKMPMEWAPDFYDSGMTLADFAKDRKTKLVAHIFGF